MSTLKIKEETLVQLTSEITDIIEEILLSKRLEQSIYSLLEERVWYSLSHIRDVFGTTTGIGLHTYIRRRSYTHIVNFIGKDKFHKLKQKETLYNIQRFKTKCIKEFPLLAKDFDINQMQKYLDKDDICYLIKKQQKTKSIDSMINGGFEDISEDKQIIDLTNNIYMIKYNSNDVNIAIDELSSFYSEKSKLSSEFYIIYKMGNK